MSEIKSRTPFFKFNIPEFNIATWHDYVEENFRSIDALLNNLFSIKNFSGVWKTNSYYTAGQVLFIGEDNGSEFEGRLVKIVSDVSTAGKATFSDSYATHPGFYELYADATAAEIFAQQAKDWATKTGDTVDGNEYSAKHYANLAKVSENNAKFQADFASTSASDAFTANVNAGIAKNAAEYSASLAKTSETNAKLSEDAAKVSETNAKESESKAKTSEDAAKLSENNAKLSENNIKDQVEQAKTAANNAEVSKTSAQAASTSAASYSNAALTAQSAAEDAAEQAKISETNAKASEVNAKASENNTKLSETNAKASENKAESAKTEATSAATSAESAKTETLAIKNEAVEVKEQIEELIEGVPDLTNILVNRSTEPDDRNLVVVDDDDFGANILNDSVVLGAYINNRITTEGKGNQNVVIGSGCILGSSQTPTTPIPVYFSYNVSIGYGTQTYGAYNVCIGTGSGVGFGNEYNIAIGYGARVEANGAIQLGAGTNSSKDTLYIRNNYVYDIAKNHLQELDNYQPLLESGTNIKTINGKSLLGEGNIEISGGGGGGTTEAVWGTITGTISDQTDLQNALNGKANVISDLETIRSGASLGSTAVQPSQLATVATSGSYNDLSNKPTIPNDISSNKVNGAPLSNASSYFFGVCETPASTAEKVVSIPSITELNAGQVIFVLPTNTSTTTYATTIKLNDFTAYPVKYGASNLSAMTTSYVLQASYPSMFIFDGNNWVFAGQGYRYIPSYYTLDVEDGIEGTSKLNRLVRADYLKQIIQGTTLTGIDVATSGTVSATDSITTAIGKLQAQIGNIETALNTINSGV